MTDEINVSRRLDVAWDSERHELIILGRRFKPADPDADEQDRADDAREVFYALTDMNRLVSEVEELVDQLRAVAGHHMIAPLREQLRKTTEQRDRALAALNQYRPDWSVFVGPCQHGFDPYTRCETCVMLSPQVVKRNAQSSGQPVGKADG